MKNMVKMAAVAAVTLLSGCAEFYIDELDGTKREGMKFARFLANDYENLAKREARVFNEQIDASHFAVKGEQATTGLNVLPEDVRDWNISDADMKVWHDHRERLTFALDNEGRDLAPELAARTQVYFDCSLQEIEENRKENVCRNGFMNSIQDLEKAIEAQSYNVSIHFEMNSSHLSHADMNKLALIAKEAKNSILRTVDVTGHTDAMGGRRHNLILSQKRAAAVKNALIGMGIDANRIVSIGAGERSHCVACPKNRRVDIHLH